MQSCYVLADIQQLARQRQLIFANRRAQRNALELEWTIETMAAFVCGLNSRHFRGVRQRLSIFDGRSEVDCDKYKARFDEVAKVVTTNPRACEFFTELAIKPMHNGFTLLVVSIHLDSQS